MLLKACLNGARLPAEHPALPVTPDELAAEAVRVVAAGAGAIHLHPKDEAGSDSLGPEAVAAALTAVRAVAGGTPQGVTTGAWSIPDPDERVQAIRAWTVLPDFASVNWHEPGAEQVAGALVSLGVGIEAGLWHGESVADWLTSPYRDRCLRALIELPDGLDGTETVARAELLLAQVRTADVQLPVLLHGEGSSCWPALRHAGRQGLDARIGLEDVLHLPDGSLAPDNAALVRAARSLLSRTSG